MQKNSNITNLAKWPKTSAGRQGRDPARIPEWQMVFSRIMIAARIVSYIVEYTALVWHRRHVDSRPHRAIHPPISPYHRHPPRTIPLIRPLNGQAKPPPLVLNYWYLPLAPRFQGRCMHLDASLQYNNLGLWNSRENISVEKLLWKVKIIILFVRENK